MDGENLNKSNIPYSKFGDNTFAVNNFHEIMDRDLIPAIFGMHSYQVKELMNFKKRKSSEDNDDVDITNKWRKIHEIMINSNSSSEDVQKWFQKYKGGKFAYLAQYFQGKDGSSILKFDQEQFKARFSLNMDEFDALDNAQELWNALHK